MPSPAQYLRQPTGKWRFKKKKKVGGRETSCASMACTTGKRTMSCKSLVFSDSCRTQAVAIHI